ncbi:hypothetical protein WI73_28975 [Burkholderia ubonensis]|nr:hypothetical protein WI73_28975 [Burkholderia ubonensis]
MRIDNGLGFRALSNGGDDLRGVRRKGIPYVFWKPAAAEHQEVCWHVERIRESSDLIFGGMPLARFQVTKKGF